MKTHFTVCFLLTIVFSFAQSEKLAAEALSGKNCRHAGVGCSLQVPDAALAKSNPTYYLQGINDHMIMLEIDADRLSQEEEQSITGKALSLFAKDEQMFMTIEEAMVLDKVTLQRLNISSKYNTIATGQYPVYKKDHVLTVVIPLVEKVE